MLIVSPMMPPVNPGRAGKLAIDDAMVRLRIKKIGLDSQLDKAMTAPRATGEEGIAQKKLIKRLEDELRELKTQLAELSAKLDMIKAETVKEQNSPSTAQTGRAAKPEESRKLEDGRESKDPYARVTADLTPFGEDADAKTAKAGPNKDSVQGRALLDASEEDPRDPRTFDRVPGRDANHDGRDDKEAKQAHAARERRSGNLTYWLDGRR
ncbi:hypothetical protein ABLE91_18715 [Aquabacter sp. CN5-332]|uniref:hypothetical protein n=1 Tax=Aquabacter sp. CN5-332 TaxID=3156608 RepID=UPI0032B507ED